MSKNKYYLQFQFFTLCVSLKLTLPAISKKLLTTRGEHGGSALRDQLLQDGLLRQIHEYMLQPNQK